VQRHQLGRFWLYQRPDTSTWFICWLDNSAAENVSADGRRGRAVTRRKATGIGGGEGDRPPQEALDALARHHLEFGQERIVEKDAAIVENIIADWLQYHVAGLSAPERYVQSTAFILEFFDMETRAGRLPRPVRVADISPGLVGRFIIWRRKAGVGGHTISRDLAALRGPLNWAWRNHKIDRAPFIADVPAAQKAPPRDRVLTMAEVGLILDACAAHPYREHVALFVIIMLATAGRPDAVLELRSDQIADGLIDFNRPGEAQTRKRRPVVPVARQLAPWLVGVSGKVIRYSAITKDGTILRRDTASIKTAWTQITAELGIEGATPKTLRHTMLTYLARKGVPKEQRQAIAGHLPQDTTGRNYEHLTPDYLRDAIRVVEGYFEELSAFTLAHLRSASDPRANKLRLVSGGNMREING
jgi:integrase